MPFNLEVEILYIKKRYLVLGSVVLVVATLFASLAFLNPFGISGIDDFAKLRLGIGVLKHYFYKDIDNEKLVDGILMGAAYSAEDPYTAYMAADTAEDYMQEVDSDDYTGVGLYITNDATDNTVTVVSPLSDSPAEKAGIVSGDKIIAVNGEAVYGEDIDDVAEKMKGKAGTEVILTVLKKADSSKKDIKLERAVVKRETVESKMLGNGVGYIEITQFGINTYDEFVSAFNSLVDKKMENLVIDLRNNPGGYMEMAVNIADIFLEKGDNIVYTMNRNEKKHSYDAKGSKNNIPLVLISNGGTASASEILIGALCDNGAAVLVGEKTFGKGVTQIPYTFSDGSLLKITDSRYYTPNGKCIDKEGILPDYEVKMSDEKYASISSLELKDDDQLSFAVELFKNPEKLAK